MKTTNEVEVEYGSIIYLIMDVIQQYVIIAKTEASFTLQGKCYSSIQAIEAIYPNHLIAAVEL